MIAEHAISTRRGVFGPRALRYVLAALLGIVLSSPASARAATDIPGISWAGGNLNGSVGGPIVDLVYAVDIPAGSVVVASLSGAPGAEMGLYLFRSGTESIFTDEPLVSSARAGGLQRVSAVVRTPGTYYLNVNGRNTDRAYAFTLTLIVKQDTSAAEYVAISPELRSRSSEVCLNLTARDSVSGISRIALWESFSSAPLQWMPYQGAGRYCLAVTPGDGNRAISASIENGVGLIRNISARVTIDDTPPTVVLATPVQGSISLRARPSMAWKFSEPIRLTAPGKDSVFATDQLGQVVRGTLSVSSDRTRVSWRPSSVLPAGSILMVNLTGILDDAGNYSNPVNSLEVTIKRPTTLRAFIARRFNGALRIGYTVSRNLVGSDIVVEGLVGGAWSQLRTITLSATTGFMRVNTSDTVKIRLRWIGSDALAPSVSNRVTP